MQVGSTVDARMISEVVAGEVIGMPLRVCLGEDDMLRITESVCQELQGLCRETVKELTYESWLMALSVRQIHSSREAPNTQGSGEMAESGSSPYHTPRVEALRWLFAYLRLEA
jgi:hypothetical protein